MLDIRYVKRIEMTLDLRSASLEEPALCEGFFWTGWSRIHLKTHSNILHKSFCDDVDGRIFPTYREYDACESLVRETSLSRVFIPSATWLIGRRRSLNRGEHIEVGVPIDFCAAIQCVSLSDATAQIQNVSVLPSARRMGLGRALVLKALRAFYDMGKRYASLEATEVNHPAMRLYTKLGFKPVRYVFTEYFVDLSPQGTIYRDLLE